MENYRKAPKLLHKGNKDSGTKSFITIPQDLLTKIFNTLDGKHGNAIKLIILLLGTVGDRTFGVSEKWVTETCGFSQPRYIDARKYLRDIGWLELRSGTLYVNINAIRGKETYKKDFSRTCEEIYGSSSTKEKQFIDVLLSKYNKKQDNTSMEEKYAEILSAGKLNCFIAYANRMTYPEYLQTNYWHMVVCEKKYSVGEICQICGIEKKLQVHHNKYDHRGQEHLFLNEDLVCLCDFCHKKFHDIGGEIDG